MGIFGNYVRSIDDKNRILIPSKFRQGIKETFFLTKDQANVITVRSKEEFELFRKSLESGNRLDSDLKNFIRYVYSNTIEQKVDKIGRINLPKDFLDHATIKKDIVFLGVGSYFEIISQENYQNFNAAYQNPKNVDELINNLVAKGVKI